MTARTYSLAEVAAQVLPREWKNPQRWLRDRLNRGEVRGYRVGREWRMTESDIEALIDSRRNSTVEVPAGQGAAVSIIDGLSQRSRQSLRASA